jgi:hypothetical protein
MGTHALANTIKDFTERKCFQSLNVPRKIHLEIAPDGKRYNPKIFL